MTMTYSWKKALLALCAGVTMLVSSCAKKFSGDDPLPVTYDPSVIISSKNQFVYAFDPKTGKKHWELNLGTPIVASPALRDTLLYVGGLNGTLYKIDAKRGKLLKTIAFPNASIVATPVVWENLVLVGTTNDTLYAIKEDEGIKCTFDAGDQIVASPATSNGKVILVSVNGRMFKMNAIDGIYDWTYDAGAGTEFHTSPVISGQYIFAGNKDGKMYSVRFADGTLKWTYQTTSVDGNTYGIFSSPIIYGGSVIFGADDSRLYCVDTSTGLHRWAEPFKTGDRIRSSPYAHQNIVYVGSYDYNLYAINILNGQKVWSYLTHGLIKSSPLVYDGFVYTASYDQYFYALDIVTGKPRWVQFLGGEIESSPMVDDLTGKSFHSAISGVN